MSHLDEGTLQALLDGELDQAEQHQIQAHLDRCAACGTRLDDVKNVRNEADRLIVSLGSVDVTAAVPPPVRPAPPRRDAAGPVLLFPDQADSELRRERRHRMLNWAAGLFVAVGVGYLALDIYGRQQLAALASAEAERPQTPEATVAAATQPVLSPAESMGADSANTGAALSSDQSPSPDPVADASTAAPEASRALRRMDASPPRPASAQAEAAAELAKIEKARNADAPRQRAQDQLGERTSRELRSAAAMADLDRARKEEERLAAERAAIQATADRAAADRAAAELAAARAAASSAPPPSLEERAGIYDRIGLDEAKRQLGTPMHVIEGMSPQVTGLVLGRSVVGMDGTRPVVRAVYTDKANRLIFLDQQRLLPGQSPGVTTQLRVVIDDVIVKLHGEPDGSVLRNLAARIQ